MADLPAGRPKKAPVRRDTHEDLSHSQGDDLGVGRPAPGVLPSLWQKVIGCAINVGAEGVQVGVHRASKQTMFFDTVGFDPSASIPFFGVMVVASII
jgi:hypothetical protein